MVGGCGANASSLLQHSAADNAVGHGSAYWPSRAWKNPCDVCQATATAASATAATTTRGTAKGTARGTARGTRTRLKQLCGCLATATDPSDLCSPLVLSPDRSFDVPLFSFNVFLVHTVMENLLQP